MIFRRGIRSFLPIAAAITLLALPALATEVPDPLPDPDGKSADMSKPVQVYILMGQSNMIGSGKPSVLQGIAAEKYPYLVDDAGAWTVRKDVRPGRIGECSTNPPTDPDVRISLIRFLGIARFHTIRTAGTTPQPASQFSVRFPGNASPRHHA
jgi:hypothetical protein